MWETISNILTSGNAVFILVTILLLVVVLAILGKKGLFSFDLKGIKMGSSENERTIIRQQSEWAKLYCDSMEPRLPHSEGYDIWRSKYILECVYDEIMT